MARNKMKDLRNHLFETLEQLKDPDKPMDIDRARAICSVAGKLIDSAKVEVKFMEVTGAQLESDFLDPSVARPQLGDGGKTNGRAQ